MRYDSLAGALIIEVSDDIARPIMDSVRKHLWPEVEYMTLELFDATNDQGYEFKGLHRYTIPCIADRVDPFFDAAKTILRQSISDSLPNSDN